MSSKINGITSLRNDLIEVYNKARTSKIDHKDLNSIVNTASKVISTAKVQITYQAHRGQNKAIPFLEK